MTDISQELTITWANRECARVATLRDYLFSRLLSGKVRVRTADAHVEETAI